MFYGLQLSDFVLGILDFVVAQWSSEGFLRFKPGLNAHAQKVSKIYFSMLNYIFLDINRL